MRTDAAPRRSRATARWGWPFFGFLLALTVLKGIRMPSRWSVTHYLFTYQFGFIKRGLWGEILRLVLRARTANYFVLAAVGFAVWALFMVLLIRQCRRLLPSPDRVPLLLVLLASPGLAFFAHLVGYLEEVGYLVWILVLVAAHRRSWRAMLTLAVLAGILLPLVHEASLLWLGALTALVVLVGSGGGERTPATRLTAVALVGLVWLLSTAGVVAFGRVTQQRAAALRDDRISFFEFRPRTDAFGTLTTSTDASWREMKARWANTNIQIDMAFSVAVFAPGAIYLCVLAVRRARAFDASPAIRWTAIALVMLAVLGPMLLHLIGRDAHRWNALAALNAGLAALTLAGTPVAARSAPAAGLGLRPKRALGLALALCIWGVSADPVFFDLYGPSHPPFSYNVGFLIDAIKSADRNIWLPALGR